ncbi:MAG: 6-carboxytetrahydropterin synthase [Bdellovibrionaceae bacterium]|nr:6-carboxytetrahydropterin synthase [Pseudobdellovibrionaceae bacterium]
MAYRIELEKENFKFSSSHFTIFGEGQAERLHGHNYYASCEIWIDSVDPKLGLAFDFNLVKPMIREITASLDEYVLIPSSSPYLQVESVGASVRVRFAAKEYVFPSEDTRLLPVVNITSEELARHITEELVARLKAMPGTAHRIREVQVGVQESRGQTVFYQVCLTKER